MIRNILARRKLMGELEFQRGLRESIEEQDAEHKAMWDLEWTKNYNPAGRIDNFFGWACIPIGLAGPLEIDGVLQFMPMATTEGALIASVCRGCKVMEQCSTIIHSDFMTRGPVFKASSIIEADQLRQWVLQHYEQCKTVFEALSKRLSLNRIVIRSIGGYVFMRFEASTGRAMGMNMLSQATEACCQYIQSQFPHARLVSLSGNFCIDKKASLLNSLEGRGKGVTAEAFISEDKITQRLKCSIDGLLEVFFSKCYLGSSLSGTCGGNNAHSANMIAAIFAATGQDLAQIVESSSCFTLLERATKGEIVGIRASVTLPCLEVATIGGGTCIPSQQAALKLCIPAISRDDSCQVFARSIAGFVLAGEISLLASLAEGSLVEAHARLNRTSG